MKRRTLDSIRPFPDVAPHAGAWIETRIKDGEIGQEKGRPPRGGVD